jgi:Uma2 family endonuclease
MSRQLAKYWISVDEYERMGEVGIFPPDARLELLEGGIYEMSPIGSRHAACVKFLSNLLSRQLGDKLIVSTQDPIRLDDFSEPQPDVALLRWRDDYYRHAHPQPADVLLVIEVADTTLESDRRYKLPLYAKAGIAEAWLVNLPEESIELYAEPADGAYRITKEFKRSEEAQAHTIADLRVEVAAVIG